jgi:hypothetical protein
MLSAALMVLTLSAGAAPPRLVCGGPYIPPVDYDRAGNPVTLEFAVSSARLGTPEDVVCRDAQRALVNRLCRLADPAYCGPLALKTRVWNTGVSGDTVCAMAVLSSSELEAWRTLLAPDLDAELRAALTGLFPKEDGPPQKSNILGFNKKKRRTAMVLIDRIDDSGAAGGVRADWLLGRVRAALTAIDVDMMEPPRGWTGVLFPKNVEFTLRGTLVERVDPKSQLPVLDIDFVLLDPDRRSRSSRPFSIPAALAPSPPRKVPPPPPPMGLSLHVESQRGGSLCPGDYTQLHLTNETDAPLHVRVINLDDNGEALVLFPNEVVTDDVVPAGATIALSPDGFNIDGAAGGRERYIAIGARTPAALGRFQSARGTCRYQPGDARYLASGANIDASFRASAGFTLLDDVRCQKPIPIPDPKLLAGLLADVRLCPPLER